MAYDLIFGRRKPPAAAVAGGLLALAAGLFAGSLPRQAAPADRRRLRKTMEIPFLTDEQLLVSEVLRHPSHRDECWATERAVTRELPAVEDY